MPLSWFGDALVWIVRNVWWLLRIMFEIIPRLVASWLVRPLQVRPSTGRPERRGHGSVPALLSSAALLVSTCVILAALLMSRSGFVGHLMLGAAVAVGFGQFSNLNDSIPLAIFPSLVKSGRRHAAYVASYFASLVSGLAVYGLVFSTLALLGVFNKWETELTSPVQLRHSDRITSQANVYEFPRWSTGGSRIAFSAPELGRKRIWTIADTGGFAIYLTHSSYDDMAPAWSPDDSQIAFIRLVDTSHGVRRGDVHVVRPDGTIPLRLTADSTVKYDVHWNRNGTAIFYADLVVTAACSVRSLWELNPATMVRTKVCEGLTGSFSLNPAGDSAVFDGAGTTSSDGDLTLIDLAARMTASLSTGLQHPRSPDWSPDGKWIAFDAGPDSARSLWVTRTSGGIPISLHSDGRSPVWSPDGKRLAYIRDDYGYKDRYHIWVGDILFRSVDTTPGTLDTRR